jgi:ubiquinone/menaquinone biosynthesis C-methylase UbiE
MLLKDAIHLIETGFGGNYTGKTWADLGCGSGVFTKALATMLGSASTIYAVDKEHQRIRATEESAAAIEFIKLDFIHDTLPFSDMDGILMANALHYVKDKSSFLEKMKTHMKPDGRFLIVEYDTERANAWVPYPLTFDRLTEIFSAHGFDKIMKIGERKSIYRSDKMVACLIEQAR